jgi:streptogramin lyase
MEEIYRLNPRTGRRQARIPVPQRPCQASDVGAGAVWTATCGVPGLARIDSKRNRVARHVALPVSTDYFGEGSIGVGAGAVWLVTDGPDCTACRVSRVDPGTMAVTAEIPVRIGAASVRVGEGSVWVSNPVEDVVQRIDPDTRKVSRTVKTGRGPRFLDVGEGAAWTLDQVDGTVTRIDADTNRTVRIAARVRGEGGDLTVGGGFVWARGSDRLLTRIDPKRRKVVARYGPSSGSGAVIVGGGAVWISAHDVNAVWRLRLGDA